MGLLRLFIGICLSFTVCVIARNIPYYDLDEMPSVEIRNQLKQHIVNSKRNALSHPAVVNGWGPQVSLGQVAGVAIDRNGNPVIFHRGSRDWHSKTFNKTHHFEEDSPIKEAVVMTLDALTGDIINSWGEDFFYLPHGITIDHKGHVWLTDVALHQVFRFENHRKTPSLTIGEGLVPGSDNSHFCQPTSVAVAKSGEFFVADGYCNSRIVKFTKEGAYEAQFGQTDMGLKVPHGLALNEDWDELCIAARENKRVICISAGIRDRNFGQLITVLPTQLRVFDVAFIDGGLVGISGSDFEGKAVGFTADGETGKIIDEWAPIQGFHNPHAIAASDSAIYVTEIGPNRVWKFNLGSKQF